MPRKAPDSVQEMRVTFGNYERQFVREVKTDIENTVKLSGLTILAMPVSVALGGCALGYGAYAGMCAIGGAIPGNPFKGFLENGKVHYDRLTDPEWWTSFGDWSQYVDKKDRP